MKNDNKLIADFMGMKYSEKRSFNDGEWTHSIQSLSRFRSWEWLMPVVSKILTNENYIDMTHRENIMDSLPYGMIDDTYDAVVEFIKNQKNN